MNNSLIKRATGIQGILLVHIVTSVSIILNIPILRQILGFIFLMFIPGFAILRILHIKERNVIDSIAFSVGLSIVFLMFVGLFMNELYPLFGVSRPLSTVPITITVMCLSMILFFVGHRLGSEKVVKLISSACSNPKALVCRVVFFSSPIVLGMVGALYNSISTLLLMILVIAVVYTLVGISRKFVSAELYPVVIFAVGMGLLLHTALISRYNIGCDTNPELYAFKLTEINGYWQKPGPLLYASPIANVKSVLSATILPTIYSSLLDVGGELIFKLIYPFIFSIVPLVMYRIFEQQRGKLFALFSALFFISMPYVFYGIEPLSLPRQILAIFFVVLSVFVLVDKSIGLQKRRILFIVFGAGLIVSHYSTAYVYLFMMALVFIFSYKRGNNKVLDEAAIVVLSVITFSWYIYISNSPLLGLTNAANNIFTFFSQDLFNPSARSTYVYTHLDPSTTQSIIGLVHRLLVYMQNFSIVIGIAILVLRRKKSSFTREYRYISIVSMFILLACLLVPNLAPSLRLERFYQITLLFLAPFGIFGGKTLLESIKKLRPILSTSSKTLQNESQQLQVGLLSLLLATLLLTVPFIFQSGFIYHVTGNTPFSYSLDLNRKMASNDLNLKIGLYEVYIPEQDVFGARWLSKNVPEASMVYADAHSRKNVLIAYALLNPERSRVLSNATSFENGTYAYLRYLNVHDNTVITERYAINTSEISFLLNCNNKIYSNGASEIYFSP